MEGVYAVPIKKAKYALLVYCRYYSVKAVWTRLALLKADHYRA